MSVSICNAVWMPSLVPEIDFLGVELSEIEIVLESLVDCEGFAHMVKSLNSLISLSEVQISLLFRVKSVLGGAFFEELLFSLGSNVSEMLENLFEIGLLLP